MLKLIPFLGSRRQLQVYFGLYRHCAGVLSTSELVELDLDAVDSLNINLGNAELNLGHLAAMVDALAELATHDVFSCGRSFFSEGTHINSTHANRVVVIFKWGS